MVPDIFADVFEAPNGDATMAGLEILAAGFAVILIGIGVWCWRQRRKRKREWTAWRKLADEQLAAMAAREDCIDEVMCQILWPDVPRRPRRLHVIKGA